MTVPPQQIWRSHEATPVAVRDPEHYPTVGSGNQPVDSPLAMPILRPLADSEGAQASAVGALDGVYAATARVNANGGSLSAGEVEAVLRAAGWPEHLIGPAMRVAWCESKWSPYASGDSGRSLGLFQLNVATWFPYAHEDPKQWADPLVNARVAWLVYQYDIDRGHLPFKQWSCGETARDDE